MSSKNIYVNNEPITMIHVRPMCQNSFLHWIIYQQYRLLKIRNMQENYIRKIFPSKCLTWRLTLRYYQWHQMVERQAEKYQESLEINRIKRSLFSAFRRKQSTFVSAFRWKPLTTNERASEELFSFSVFVKLTQYLPRVFISLAFLSSRSSGRWKLLLFWNNSIPSVLSAWANHGIITPSLLAIKL